MAYPTSVQRSIDAAQGTRRPLGYVAMVGARPLGPMRETPEAALKDAVDEGEAWVCLQYRQIFEGALTWIAPVWP